MKIAILGGSFNPIHIGHLALADAVCCTLQYDKVLFIPTFSPPHKEMNDCVPAEKRLKMVRLACEGDSRFEAEDCEIRRRGVSYTYDTVRFIEQKYSGQLEGKLGLVVGEDLLPGFHLWHKAEDLAKICDIVVAKRPLLVENTSHSNRPQGAYADADSDFDAGKEPLLKNAVWLFNAQLPVSSTDIRTRAGRGGGFRYLVPYPVFRYIIDGHLYE